MTGLMYKDFICAKMGWYFGGILLGLLLLVAAIPFIPEDIRGVIMMLYLTGYILSIYGMALGIKMRSVMEADKGKNIEAYVLSLPVGRKRYITEKYLIIFGMFFILTLISLFSFLMAKQVSSEVALQNMGKQMIPLLPAITGISLIIAGIEMPFCFRFGVKAGGNVRTAIFVALFFGALVYLMFGNLEILEQFNLESIWNYLSKHPKLFERCKVGIPIVGILFYMLSGMLSYWLYSKKPMGE